MEQIKEEQLLDCGQLGKWKVTDLETLSDLVHDAIRARGHEEFGTEIDEETLLLCRLQDMIKGAIKYGWCGHCHRAVPVSEQYSFGAYAGRMCDDCAYTKYSDHCGLRGAEQGNPAELDGFDQGMEDEALEDERREADQFQEEF